MVLLVFINNVLFCLDGLLRLLMLGQVRKGGGGGTGATTVGMLGQVRGEGGKGGGGLWYCAATLQDLVCGLHLHTKGMCPVRVSVLSAWSPCPPLQPYAHWRVRPASIHVKRPSTPFHRWLRFTAPVQDLACGLDLHTKGVCPMCTSVHATVAGPAHPP